MKRNFCTELPEPIRTDPQEGNLFIFRVIRVIRGQVLWWRLDCSALFLFAFALFLACVASVRADVHYVDVNSTNATPPYTNWATAATNIQDAVYAAVAGDEIVVTNGTYAGGVDIGMPLTVRSVSGPQFTTIAGGGPCVSLASNVSLSGFTLTNGHAPNAGGAIRGTLNNCILTRNTAYGSQFSPGYGGGAVGCTLNNCRLTGNLAGGYGGGADVCTLNDCTLTGNSASYYGGAAYGCTLNNCISYENFTGGAVCEDCAQAHLAGNNWFGDPLFVDHAGGNLRLQSNSPCINAGNNAFAPAGPDLDGNPRIAGGTVDIGAYEFHSPGSMISYDWLQRYGLLPATVSTDTEDPDGDGVNNYREWLAGSDPTNPFSFPPLLNLIPYGSNVILTWPTNAFGFTLQSTTNLGSPAVWSTNSTAPVVIGGQNVIINPITGAQQFYRLVQ